jgi:energy-coupling factor transport system substrate-specific component
MNETIKKKTKNPNNLTIRDYITTAIVLVLGFMVYAAIGFPLGMTIVGSFFIHAACSLVWGTIFLILYTRVNKKWIVLILGMVLALVQLMNAWPTTIFMAVGAVIAEVVWQKMDRKKFRTMMICFVIQITFWYLGNYIPLMLATDISKYMSSNYVEMYTSIQELVKGPLFYAGLAAVIGCSIAGAYIGKYFLKKHFKKAGIV